MCKAKREDGKFMYIYAGGGGDLKYILIGGEPFWLFSISLFVVGEMWPYSEKISNDYYILN